MASWAIAAGPILSDGRAGEAIAEAEPPESYGWAPDDDRGCEATSGRPSLVVGRLESLESVGKAGLDAGIIIGVGMATIFGPTEAVAIGFGAIGRAVAKIRSKLSAESYRIGMVGAGEGVDGGADDASGGSIGTRVDAGPIASWRRKDGRSRRTLRGGYAW